MRRALVVAVVCALALGGAASAITQRDAAPPVRTILRDFADLLDAKAAHVGRCERRNRKRSVCPVRIRGRRQTCTMRVMVADSPATWLMRAYNVECHPTRRRRHL